ncbi:MAG: nucleoside triphosphate pyrophosphohydrolase [Halanaerobium sp.]|nr:nucleoside triphosphate pyrophosphohydrolase [Halanaerobium sp.]
MSCQQMERLLKIMHRLRGEEGCPWDKEQTHRSLRPYLLEEAYEVLEAIDEDDSEHLKEELGDLLLQIVFHSVIAEEEGEFSFGGVADGISDKLVHRHPHVFGDFQVNNAREVKTKWDKIKAEERKGQDDGKESILDYVPVTLPALSLAMKVQEKAAEVGFDWPDIAGAKEKLNEEIAEFNQALTDGDMDALEDELGDIFFALVNVARFLGLDAELSLRNTVRKFASRFNYIEERLATVGKELNLATLQEMDELWEEAKGREEAN